MIKSTPIQLFYLVIFGAITYIASITTTNYVNVKPFLKNISSLLMSLPRMVMMILMAIPEQTVLAIMEPQLPLFNRILVSIAMYVVHFAWNGLIMKPEKSYNELVWILGTALYAYMALGVKKETAIALIAADSAMTLSLRGLA